jgi:hypothetical protein
MEVVNINRLKAVISFSFFLSKHQNVSQKTAKGSSFIKFLAHITARPRPNISLSRMDITSTGR